MDIQYEIFDDGYISRTFGSIAVSLFEINKLKKISITFRKWKQT